MSEQTAYFNLVTRLTTVADSGSTQKMSAFRSELGKVTDASTMMGKAVATAAGFITYQLISTALMGIKNFVSGSIEAFVEFEYAMAGVERTVSDFAENEAVLNEFASTMSQGLGVAATDVAEAMQYMGSVGYDSADIMRDFNDIAKMGVALQIDLEDAIQTVVKAQQVWNDEGYTATQISDTLNQMTNKTALNMEFLSGALRMGGPAAASTNTSLEEMVAILVELAETGFKGTMAGRSLNTILIKMGLESDNLLGALSDLKKEGFDVNLEAMNGFKSASPIEQIQMLAQATDGLTDSQKIQIAQMVGGTNFLKQMLILLENAEDLTDNLAVATDSAGSSQEEFNVVMGTSEMKLRQQREELAATQRQIGERLTPAWLNLKGAIYDTTSVLVDWLFPVGEAKEAQDRQREAAMMLNQEMLALGEQVDRGIISQYEYAAAVEEAKKRAREYASVEEEVKVALDETTLTTYGYVDAMDRASTKSQELTNRVNEVRLAQMELAIAERDVRSATYELEAALGYAETGVEDLTQTMSIGTWYVGTAETAYNDLGAELYQLQQEIRATENQLAELDDQMFSNSLESAELRYSQLELQRQLKEGEITSKSYEDQMEDLEDQMFYNRLEGAKLNVENMKLTDTYEDQKDEADLLTDQMDSLKTANETLTTAVEGFTEMGGALNQILEKMDEWLGYVSGEADDVADSFDDAEDELSQYLETYDDYEERKANPTYPPPPPPDDPVDPSPPPPGSDVSLASGFEGWVNQPTRMLVGEAGPEYVSVTPAGRQRPLVGGSGTDGARNIGDVYISLPNVNSVEDPDQVRQVWRRIMLELSGER